MRVGITERGDPSLDFSWVSKLLPANIIITKNLNDELIKHLIDNNNKERIILHLTCTGFGGSIVEPKVPPKEYSLIQFEKLLSGGFPVRQTVLRVDPIVPTPKGLRTAEEVLGVFSTTGVKRVRYSFLDMYPHVKKRLLKARIKLPYKTFSCPEDMKDRASGLFKLYERIYEFEACAENTSHQLGCISQKDLDILGIKEEVKPAGFQREGCLCIAGKTELLSSKRRCLHGCLYCYWKD